MSGWRDQIASIIAETERNLGQRVGAKAAPTPRPPVAYFMGAQRGAAPVPESGDDKASAAGGAAQASERENVGFNRTSPSEYARLSESRVMETVK